MKDYRRKSDYILVLALICSVASSCRKFVEAGQPKNQVTTPVVFSDSANATAALLGLYINVMSSSTSFNLLNGGITQYAGLAADEITSNDGVPDEQEFYTNAVSSVTNSTNGSLWQFGYQLIYQANACIEGLTSSELSETVSKQLLGEAKVFRALCYFNLVNLYGPVPLVTSTAYKGNAVLPRMSTDSIYQQIISDLTDAESLLSDKYITSDRTRINRYTAAALLARVYLYRQEWDKAENEATKVISAGVYDLEDSLNDVFLPGSEEAIWQMPPLQEEFGTAEGFLFVPADRNTIPNISISSFLLKSFDPGDHRFVNWLDSNVVNGLTYYFPFKYKVARDYSSPPTEYYMIFRLGEQFLIRAEARAQQNRISDAADDLNRIRNRAGLPNTHAANQSDMLDSIYHERQIELFCESGHRWFDLKRSGRIDNLMGSPGEVCAAKGGVWSSDWKLFPVPNQEIQVNTFLRQNPGYQ